MMASRIPSILPDLTFDESLEITKIHSIAGILPENIPLIKTRPFRSPHHSVSNSALVGGGKVPKPGEISLAHYGVLFLDEIPEFRKDVLELLREPIEDGKITISRVASTLTYPSKFMLVASMNPCPCGFYGSKTKECTCTREQVNKYIGKLSGPLLDRIDIHIEVQSVPFDKLSSDRPEESSKTIKERVDKARKIQNERYKDDKILSNSELTPELIKKYCKLNDECLKLLKQAFDKLELSARAHDKIIKLARTISDLDNSQDILPKHIAEAIQYRSLDRKYWK
jgi:magnesium chelatase family protein